jgi:hypothetical protein
MGMNVKHYLKDGTVWKGSYHKCLMENYIQIKLIQKLVNLFFIMEI